MPAARMGDMATCIGPPDSIASGCLTVLIGTGQASAPKKYSEDYIKARYNKSIVTTQQKLKKNKTRITSCLARHKPDEEEGCENDSIFIPGSWQSFCS